jgi:DNA-binding NarL/FixJ family response regulator
MVGEAMQAALSTSGFVTAGLGDDLEGGAGSTAGTRPTDVGLLIAALETFPDIHRAEQLISRFDGPWVVVAQAPRGLGWGAMLAASASCVLHSSVPLAEIVTVLDDLGHGRPVGDDALDRQLVSQWEDAKRERDELSARLVSLAWWELTILHELYRGRSISGIADQYGVAVTSVNDDLEGLLEKLDLGSQLTVVTKFGDLLGVDPGAPPGP